MTKTYGEAVVRLGFFNFEHDGGPEKKPGVLPARWTTAHIDLLVPRRFDWLGRAEMTYSQSRPAGPDATGEELIAAEQAKEAANRRFRAAQDLLDMKGFRSPMGQGRNPTGTFIRESTFEFVARHPQLSVWRTPPTNVVLRLREVPERDIVTLSSHNSFCSPTGREAEGFEMSALWDKVQAKHGDDTDKPWSAFWGASDWNEYPVPNGETVKSIDWTSPDITDFVHRAHRARRQPDGSWKSCTDLDQLMLECGMHDPARYAARYLPNQARALDATAGHVAVGQGGGRRIDRWCMDPWTVQATLEVNVVDTSGISDHHLVEVILSRRKLVEALRRQFQPLDPWTPTT